MLYKQPYLLKQQFHKAKTNFLRADYHNLNEIFNVQSYKIWTQIKIPIETVVWDKEMGAILLQKSNCMKTD